MECDCSCRCTVYYLPALLTDGLRFDSQRVLHHVECGERQWLCSVMGHRLLVRQQSLLREGMSACHNKGASQAKAFTQDTVVTVACRATHLELYFEDEEMSLTRFSARSDRSSPRLTYSQHVDHVSVPSSVFRFCCHVAAMSAEHCANVGARRT